MSSPFPRVLLVLPIILTGLSTLVCSQPRMKTSTSLSYRVGDRVIPETTVYTQDLEARTLGELVETDTQVVVLILFGGSAPTAPGYHPLRGGIWCPDTFDEFPIYRALLRYFRDDPVQFIPVAVPPAYSNIYGFEKDVFISRADDDPVYRQQVEKFIELTEETRETDILPFAQVFYDPRYRLAYDPKREMGPDYGPIYDWQGKFRWYRDPRKYTTPSLWILGSDLKLLREPFVGNNYNTDPPQIRYEYSDLKETIESLLAR